MESTIKESTECEVYKDALVEIEVMELGKDEHHVEAKLFPDKEEEVDTLENDLLGKCWKRMERVLEVVRKIEFRKFNNRQNRVSENGEKVIQKRTCWQ